MKLIKIRSRSGIDMSVTAEAVVQAYRELVSDPEWASENPLEGDGRKPVSEEGAKQGKLHYLLFVTSTPENSYREVIITTNHDFISQDELRLVKSEAYPSEPDAVRIVNFIDLGWMRDGQF